MSADDYIHGTDPDEQQRLTQLNGLINATCLAEIRPRPGERVLDIGAGLGQMTRALARATSRQALGIERSPEQIAEALRQAKGANESALIELRAGDVHSLPLQEGEWGQFDLAHARFVLEHVHDPLRVVQGMVRALRPGGRIVLLDDDHAILRLRPEQPRVMVVWSAYIESYRRAGKDPFIGARLVELIAAAGAKPVRIAWPFFGACAGEPSFPGYVDNLRTILSGAREAILATGRIDESTFDGALYELVSFRARPDGAFWYAIAFAEGRS